MTQNEAAVISQWLIDNFAPSKTPRFDTYGLKHHAEAETGVYTDQTEFEAIASLLGHKIVTGEIWVKCSPAFRKRMRDKHSTII